MQEMQDTWIRAQNQKDPLEKELATHPAGYSPWSCNELTRQLGTDPW